MQNFLPSEPIVVTHSVVPRIASIMFPVEGITLWPFIFMRGDVNPLLLNHESIHFAQYRELWIVGFFAVYFFDFVRNLIHGKSVSDAYSDIRLEVEAYDNEADFTYLETRKGFAWSSLV